MRKSQEWIVENFESLVSQYEGKYIGVVDEKFDPTNTSQK